MAGSIAIQTIGASMYKIQALTVGKNNELWKHPYWTTALTTVGELLAFVVYFAKEKYFKRKRLLESYEGQKGTNARVQDDETILVEDDNTTPDVQQSIDQDQHKPKKKVNRLLFAIPAIFD